MIKTLRKRHRQVWMAWAVLLPAGIVFSWLAIPNQSPVKLLKTETIALLPDVVRSVDKKDYQVTIRTNREKTQWQLEWQNKTVLAVPSAVVYKLSPDTSRVKDFEGFQPQKAELIGRIEARTDYVFPLNNDSTGYKELILVLYDFIHEKVIDTINF